MPHKSCRGMVLTIIPVLFTAALAQAQAPPSPTGSDRKAIREHISYWTERLSNAEDGTGVIAARKKLLEGYREIRDTDQNAYAEAASRITTELLRNPPAKLRQLKEVNVAVFFAEMRNAAARTAYEIMVRHPNDAVRYLGWEGYHAVRTDILALERPGSRLLATLREAAKGEESPVVAEGLFRMLEAPELTTTPMIEGRLAQVRKQLLEIFGVCWSNWCKRVLAGNVAAAESCVVGVSALLKSADVMEKDEAAKTAVLQMLADMLWCSSKAYEDAKYVGPAAATNGSLLISVERALNVITVRLQRPVAEALRSKPEDVRLQSLMWIHNLSALGVKDPQDKFKPKPTTTTAPGSGK